MSAALQIKRHDGREPKPLAEIFDEENYLSAMTALSAMGISPPGTMSRKDVIKLWIENSSQTTHIFESE